MSASTTQNVRIILPPHQSNPDATRRLGWLRSRRPTFGRIPPAAQWVFDTDLDGSLSADVAITDGRIVAVEPGIPATAAATAIDATGLLILPGVVDVHTHTRIASDEEPDRFYQDSVAAAFGGTTTFLAFNNPGTGSSPDAPVHFRSILCPVDFSDGSIAALEQAFSLAEES